MMIDFNKAKEKYNSTEIPRELETVVGNSIKQFETKQKSRAKMRFMRIAPVAACAVICLVVGISTLPENSANESLITADSADAGVPELARSVPAAGAGNGSAEDEAMSNSKYAVSNKAMTETAVRTEKLPFEAPLEMCYSSGGGAWGTDLVLNNDGTFTGYFSDMNLGEIGEGYPNGTIYQCEFSGAFTDFVKLDDLTYSMKLSSLLYDEKAAESGKEYISEGVRYVSEKPCGIVGGEEFVFYLPETPVSLVPEEALFYWFGTEFWIGEDKEILSCYGLVNNKTGKGFFSDIREWMKMNEN